MRLPRLSIVGVSQHVLLRSNNKELLFRHSHDYRIFSEYLNQSAGQFSCAIHAYVFMPDHIHLLLTPSHEKSVSKMVQLLARRYVQYFNRRYNRCGNLFESRFKSSLVESDSYAMHCYKYIESNPMRASLVNNLKNYIWSSYRHNALGETDVLITKCKEYMALGAGNEARQKAYQASFYKSLTPEILHTIRRQTQRSLPLGETSFIEQVEQVLGIEIKVRARGGDHRSLRFRALSQA
jgi:putative transposase